MKIVVRATNWLGDAVMSLPALRAIRLRYPDADIAVAAKPWVAALYDGERSVDRLIVLSKPWWQMAWGLRRERFDLAILFPNSFNSAAMMVVAGVRRRIGYARDGRSFLLTDAIGLPQEGELPPHERFYYLELLNRAIPGLALHQAPPEIRFDGIDEARRRGELLFAARGIALPVAGVSPGAAYGTAKRWLPERFAEAAAAFGTNTVVFGSAAERGLCESVALKCGGTNLAGATTLREFIDMTAACELFLTNDSGAMHIASALDVPSVTVFGPTDEAATGPTGPNAAIVRQPVDCAPCKLRECPIDHRCMTGVTVGQVVAAGVRLRGCRKP